MQWERPGFYLSNLTIFVTLEERLRKYESNETSLSKLHISTCEHYLGAVHMSRAISLLSGGILPRQAGPLPYECNFKNISKLYVGRDPVKSGSARLI